MCPYIFPTKSSLPNTAPGLLSYAKVYSCVGPRPELGSDLLLLNFEHFLSVQRAKVVTPLFHHYAHAPPQNTFLPRFPGEKIDFPRVRNTHEETNHVRTTMRIRRHGLDKLVAKLAANPLNSKVLNELLMLDGNRRILPSYLPSREACLCVFVEC